MEMEPMNDDEDGEEEEGETLASMLGTTRS